MKTESRSTSGPVFKSSKVDYRIVVYFNFFILVRTKLTYPRSHIHPKPILYNKITSGHTAINFLQIITMLMSETVWAWKIYTIKILIKCVLWINNAHKQLFK